MKYIDLLANYHTYNISLLSPMRIKLVSHVCLLFVLLELISIATQL